MSTVITAILILFALAVVFGILASAFLGVFTVMSALKRTGEDPAGAEVRKGAP